MRISKSQKNRHSYSAFASASEKETREIGKLFGEEFIKHPPRLRGACVISLAGDLGSGKTTFVKGLARGLGIRHRIMSPTFLLLRMYRFGENKRRLLHIDAYRIASRRDAAILENRALYSEPGDIAVIEWPENIPHIIPKPDIRITFGHGNKEHERSITIQTAA